MRILSTVAGIALMATIALTQNSTAVVRGNVARLDNGAPLSEVLVALVSESDNKVVARMPTDASGRFEFRNVAPGPYQVQAQRQGFFGPLSHEESRNIISRGITAEPQRTSDLSLGMLPGGVISGRVVGADGVPAAGAIVSARRAFYRSGFQTLGQAANVRADANGRYRLYDLGAGSLYIHAEAGPGQTAIDTGTYYPSVSDFEAALPVVVQPGSEQSSIDIQLRTSRTVPLKVRVVNEKGNLRGAALNMQPQDRQGRHPAPIPGITSTIFLNLSSSSNQAEQTLNERPGSYDLTAMTTPTGAGEQGRVSLRVGDGAPDSITVVVRPPVDVSARVVTNGNASNVSMDTRNLQFKLEQRDRAGYGISPAPGSNFAGTFTFQGVPESKAVPRILGLRSGDYIADVRQNGRSVFNDGLITVGRQPVAIEWEVRTGGGRVEGTVQRASTGNVADTRVVLVPDSPRRSNSLLYQVTNPDAAGRFTLQGIAPGNYRIFAWESIPDSAWENAEYLASFERFGRAVSVASDRSVNANVDWIPKTVLPASPVSNQPSAPAISTSNTNVRTIEGVVTNAADGKPIAGARVRIMNSSARMTTITDPDGKFLLAPGADGKFDVVVDHDAYFGPLTNGSYSDGATQSVTLDARKARAQLAFTLNPAGAISGRILDSEGGAARQVSLDLINLTATTRNGRARTDDRGEFHVTRMFPGQYIVAVEQATLIAGPTVSTGGAGARTYYPGTVDSSRALPVTVNPGSDIRDLNFQIVRVPTVSIFGKIATDLTGVDGAAGMRITPSVTAVSNDVSTVNPNPIHQGVVDSRTGEFEIRGLQPGTYTVVAKIPIPAINVADLVNVEVGTQDVRDVQLVVRRGVEVRVKIVNGARNPSVTRVLSLAPRLRPVGLGSRISGSSAAASLVLPNVFAGTYDLVLDSFIVGECVRDIRQGGRSVLQSGITIGKDFADSIEFVLETRSQPVPRVPGDAATPRCANPKD